MHLLSTLFPIIALIPTVLSHGYVSGIVANGVYTAGWQVSYWYDIINKVPYPQTPGWYEEALDLGFVAPDQYSYVFSSFSFSTFYFQSSQRRNGLTDLIKLKDFRYYMSQKRRQCKCFRYCCCRRNSTISVDYLAA